MIIPLGPRSPGASRDLPGSLGGPPSGAPLFGLAPGGVFRAADVAADTGELLPHPFTLTVAEPRRSGFCGTFRGVSPPGRYPAPCPVEPGLSSSGVARRRRSPDLLRLQPISVRKVFCGEGGQGPQTPALPPEASFPTSGVGRRLMNDLSEKPFLYYVTFFASAGQWPSGPGDRPRGSWTDPHGKYHRTQTASIFPEPGATRDRGGLSAPDTSP